MSPPNTFVYLVQGRAVYRSHPEGGVPVVVTCHLPPVAGKLLQEPGGSGVAQAAR